MRNSFVLAFKKINNLLPWHGLIKLHSEIYFKQCISNSKFALYKGLSNYHLHLDRWKSMTINQYPTEQQGSTILREQPLGKIIARAVSTNKYCIWNHQMPQLSSGITGTWSMHTKTKFSKPLFWISLMIWEQALVQGTPSR